MARFDSKVALVTGAGSRRGIGRATALALAAEGARIVVTDSDAEGVARVADELARHGDALGAAADVRSKADMERVVAEATARFGGLDYLVNNAGITRPATFLEITEDEYDLVLDVNLKGTFITTQAAVPALLARGGGAIVSLASVSGQRGFFGSPHYCASKAGILGLTKALARELTPQGIRVNCVAPAMVDTDISGGPFPPEAQAAQSADALVGRVATTRDVVGSILFLLSDEAAYLTGVTLDINGGSHLH